MLHNVRFKRNNVLLDIFPKHCILFRYSEIKNTRFHYIELFSVTLIRILFFVNNVQLRRYFLIYRLHHVLYTAGLV